MQAPKIRGVSSPHERSDMRVSSRERIQFVRPGCRFAHRGDHLDHLSTAVIRVSIPNNRFEPVQFQ
jgi:hypothetical protein